MHGPIAVLLVFIITFDFILASPRIKSIGTDRKTNLSGIIKKSVRQDSEADSEYVSEDDEEYDDGKNGSYEEGDDEYDDNKSIEIEDEGQDAVEEDSSSQRSLVVGDAFTPQELLLLTKIFIKKVENPGEGKGIVSGAKSAEALADKLFEGYFLTPKRIVVLEEADLPGLDALQALALNGDAVDPTVNSVRSYTEPPSNVTDIDGEMRRSRRNPGKCHYRVLTKKVNIPGKPNSRRRQGIVAGTVDRSGKKRHLIVNTRHKSSKSRKGNFASESVAKGKRKSKRTQRKVKKGHKKVGRNKKSKRSTLIPVNQIKKHKAMNAARSNCHWKYQCKNPGILETCRLHMVCAEDRANPKMSSPSPDGIYMQHLEDEHYVSIAKFRKMLGITLLDEEVEKIIQNQVLRKRGEFGNDEIIETLEEYFNSIIVGENSRTTTPSYPSTESNHAINAEDIFFESEENSTTVSTPIEGTSEERRHFPSIKSL